MATRVIFFDWIEKLYFLLRSLLHWVDSLNIMDNQHDAISFGFIFIQAVGVMLFTCFVKKFINDIRLMRCIVQPLGLLLLYRTNSYFVVARQGCPLT